MKLQLDTENKTIKLEKDVVLSNLIETLEKLLPHGEWKEFTLETNTVIHQWSNPVVLPSVIPYPVVLATWDIRSNTFALKMCFTSIYFSLST
jgi:hypothetical protein